MVRRLQAEAEAHPESADDLCRAEQIVCECVRDAAEEERANCSKFQNTLMDAVLEGRGIRGTP